MRRILATALLALSAVVGLPGTAHAGGPTSVLITQVSVSAGALYYSDDAYDELLGLLPDDETRGKARPPAGGIDYNLTWMVHDFMPWRYDHVSVAGDGTAWVSTTYTTDTAGGWVSMGAGTELFELLKAVLDDSAAPVVATPADDVPQSTPLAAPQEPRTTWYSLTGWRWVVPGGLLGLLVGAVAARRHRDEEPRRVLISSGA